MALTIPSILLAMSISTYVRTQDILRLPDHRTYAEDHEAFSEHYGHHQLNILLYQLFTRSADVHLQPHNKI